MSQIQTTSMDTEVEYGTANQIRETSQEIMKRTLQLKRENNLRKENDISIRII